MATVRSWWRLKKVRHRDAVILSVGSSASLLSGELANQAGIPWLYSTYLAPVDGQPLLFALNSVLVVLAYTTYFGGIFVLLGGLHFSWGRIDRGRFLVSLGVGISFVGLLKQFALAVLMTGTPFTFFLGFSGLIGIGLLLGFASHLLMGEYALMLKKHAKSAWRQWRRSRRPARRRARSSANAR
jgi:hypothetical protein